MSNAMVPYGGGGGGPLVPYTPPATALTRVGQLSRALDIFGRTVPIYNIIDFVVEEATGKGVKEHAAEKIKEYFTASGYSEQEASSKSVSPELAADIAEKVARAAGAPAVGRRVGDELRTIATPVDQMLIIADLRVVQETLGLGAMSAFRLAGALQRLAAVAQTTDAATILELIRYCSRSLVRP